MKIYIHKQYTAEELKEQIGDKDAILILQWFRINKRKTVLKLPNGVKIRKSHGIIGKYSNGYPFESHTEYDKDTKYMIITDKVVTE